ncbi:unnamed protein product [Brassica oleracea]
MYANSYNIELDEVFPNLCNVDLDASASTDAPYANHVEWAKALKRTLLTWFKGLCENSLRLGTCMECIRKTCYCSCKRTVPALGYGNMGICHG